MILSRSIRAFITVAIVAAMLAAILPLVAPVMSGSASAAMPPMACATCNHHPDMALTGCAQIGCPIIVSMAEIDHHAMPVSAGFPEEPASPYREWLIVPPVPPG